MMSDASEQGTHVSDARLTFPDAYSPLLYHVTDAYLYLLQHHYDHYKYLVYSY